MSQQIWWYIARSGGIVAWALVTVSVCWGLFLSTRAANKAAQPANILDLHRFLGGLSVVFTAIHVFGLVMDSYVQFGPSDILVPWAASWKPSAVAWGVIAMYLLLAVEITSLLMKKLPRPFWRQVHRASFGLYVFSTVHGIEAGSDTLNEWYQMAMIASVNIVAFLTVLAILAHKKAEAAKADRRPAATHAV